MDNIIAIWFGIPILGYAKSKMRNNCCYKLIPGQARNDVVGVAWGSAVKNYSSEKWSLL